MLDRSEKWTRILGKIIEDNGYNETGKVNYCNLASLLEEMSNRIDELENKLKN